MRAPELVEISRYPVKSMLGESLQSAFLGENGIPGDRAWATRDEKRGAFGVPSKYRSLCASRRVS